MDADFFHPNYHYTRTGRKVYLDQFSPDDVDIPTIARRLSSLNRWRGDTSVPWSVASHSLMMYDAAKRIGGAAPLLLSILLHDAAEAYCIDLPADIKQRPDMQGYRDLIGRVESVIAEKYGTGGYEADVKTYDRWAAETEFRELIYPATSQTYCQYAERYVVERRFRRTAESLVDGKIP